MQWLVIHEWSGYRAPNGVRKIPEGAVLDDAVEDVPGLIDAGLRAVPLGSGLAQLLRARIGDPNDELAAAVMDLRLNPPAVGSSFALTFGGGTLIGPGTGQRFAAPWYSSGNWVNVDQFLPNLPFDVTVDRLTGIWTPGAAGPIAVDWVIRKDGVDTALATTTLAASGAASNLVDSFTLMSGERLSLVARKSASLGDNLSGVSFSVRASVI